MESLSYTGAKYQGMKFEAYYLNLKQPIIWYLSEQGASLVA